MKDHKKTQDFINEAEFAANTGGEYRIAYDSKQAPLEKKDLSIAEHNENMAIVYSNLALTQAVLELTETLEKMRE